MTTPVSHDVLRNAATGCRDLAAKAFEAVMILDRRGVPPQLGTYQVAAALGVFEALAEALEAAATTDRRPETMWPAALRAMLDYALTELADGAEDGGLPNWAAAVRDRMAQMRDEAR